MKPIMFVTKLAAFTVLVSSSVGFADLASLSTVNGNAAADALTRIAASKHFEGANIAALDPGTNLEEDLVYYSTLDLKTETPDLSGGPLGAGGGGGLGWTDPGDNGVIGGGGGGGSGPGPTDNTGGGRTTPSPGAAILALIGMCCVGGARRRV